MVYLVTFDDLAKAQAEHLVAARCSPCVLRTTGLNIRRALSGGWRMRMVRVQRSGQLHGPSLLALPAWLQHRPSTGHRLRSRSWPARCMPSMRIIHVHLSAHPSIRILNPRLWHMCKPSMAKSSRTRWPAAWTSQPPSALSMAAGRLILVA